MRRMMLYLFHFCSVTPESPRAQCCCQILVSTEARAQNRLPPGSPPLTRSPLLLLPSVSLRLTITLLNLRKQCNPGFLFFFPATQHSTVCLNVFLPSIAREQEKLFLWSVLGHIKAPACQRLQLQHGSNVFSAFSQQRPAAHPKDHRRPRTDFINSKEPEGKTDKHSPSLFTFQEFDTNWT